MRVLLIFLLSISISIPSVAAVRTYSFNPGKILLSEDGEYGGCLVEPKITLDGLNCNSKWVSLDCAGVLGGSKSAAQRKLDATMLARVTRGKVSMRIDDSKKINGWCYVDRVVFIR